MELENTLVKRHRPLSSTSRPLRPESHQRNIVDFVKHFPKYAGVRANSVEIEPKNEAVVINVLNENSNEGSLEPKFS